MSKVPIRLPKTFEVATLGVAPTRIVAIQEVTPFNPVIAVPIHKGKLNKERQFDQRQQVTRTDKEEQEIG